MKSLGKIRYKWDLDNHELMYPELWAHTYFSNISIFFVFNRVLVWILVFRSVSDIYIIYSTVYQYI